MTSFILLLIVRKVGLTIHFEETLLGRFRKERLQFTFLFVFPDLCQTKKPNDVRFAIRFTFPCLHSLCTCEPIIRTANVQFVAKPFHAHGYCKVTSELTRVGNPFHNIKVICISVDQKRFFKKIKVL